MMSRVHSALSRLWFVHFSLAKGVLVYGILCLWGCGPKFKSATSEKDSVIPQIYFDVVNKYPHGSSNFTEGLFAYGKNIIEGTGQKGDSRILSYTLSPAPEEKELARLSPEFFGEGVSIIDNKLYQLTWQDHKVFAYEYPSMKLSSTMDIDFEGWGMTASDKALIVSDGTSVIRWMDPLRFQEIKRIHVTDAYGDVDYINELELIRGFLYANRWQTNTIYKIDTATGKIVGFLDISYLSMEAKNADPKADVANGIAFLPERNTLVLTGKNWPFLYEVALK